MTVMADLAITVIAFRSCYRRSLKMLMVGIPPQYCAFTALKTHFLLPLNTGAALSATRGHRAVPEPPATPGSLSSRDPSHCRYGANRHAARRAATRAAVQDRFLHARAPAGHLPGRM